MSVGDCLHKEFFGMGMFVMGVILFYVEVISSMVKNKN